MKRFLIISLILFVTNNILYAMSDDLKFIEDGEQAIYSPLLQEWVTEKQADYEVAITKTLFNGEGGYSEYNYSDGSRAFTLNTNTEFINNGFFVVVDNSNLKYNQIVYENENFEEVPLSYLDLQKMFPEAEIIKLSHWSGDNKIWITKPFFKKKQILIVNDTDKYYYNLTAKSKNAQNTLVKGLITLSRFGIYNFVHYGERNGKLTIYVR